jgi:hypothetical protein
MRPQSRADSPRISGIRRSSAYAAVGAVLLAGAFACGDKYLHTNPYDPAVPVEVTITGPDTMFSSQEIADYHAQVVPSWPDTGFVWAVDSFVNYFIVPGGECMTQVSRGDSVLAVDGAGSYRSTIPPLEPYSYHIEIELRLGTIDTVKPVAAGCDAPTVFLRTKVPRHIAYKEIVVMQRVTRMQLRCPDTHACAPIAVGDSAFIWVDGFDALGHPIVALTSSTANPASGNPHVGNPLTPYIMNDPAVQRAQQTNNPVATYVSRDSTIARATPIGIRVAKVTGMKSGTTWIVATRGALADSLQIVVR